MSTEVIMPQMGESVTEGTITTWFKQVGEFVEKDEALLLISTDKVDADVPSPASGYVQELKYPEGTTVEIDTVVAILGSTPEQAKTQSSPTASPAEPSTATEAPTSPQTQGLAKKMSAETDVDALRRQKSSPLVRRMAAEHNFDISGLEGTGISGRVTKKDFLAALAQRGTTPAANAPQPLQSPGRVATPDPRFRYQPLPSDRVEPFTPIRAAIAEHMVASRDTSVHVTTVFEIDMTRVVRLRENYKPAYAKKGVKLSFMPFILKCTVDALNAYPVLNSAVVERSIVYRPEINLGVAVAVDWGLLVPVLRNADERSLLGLSRELNDLAERARQRKLGPDELKGGTFTVTNPGVFGSLFGTPIINQPQVAILCVGTITKRPVVTEDDAIAIRHMMYMSLSFDHRIVDGATGDRFMKTIKDGLENFPEELL